ncbi:MAG: hypothetical protein ACPGVN_05575 [Alphaproteobacteria bacterium]
MNAIGNHIHIAKVTTARKQGWFSGWRLAMEFASPLLNSLALTALSSILIGLVFGGVLFGTSVPAGSFLSFQAYLQHLLSPFSTWQYAQGQMALFHPIIDTLVGDFYGLNLVAYGLLALIWVLSVGLLFRCFQKGWNGLGYSLELSLGKWVVGAIGLVAWPIFCLAFLKWLSEPFFVFMAASPWVKVLLMGIAAWVFFAGIIFWATPKKSRVYAVFVGATTAALIFAALEPLGQWIIGSYGPFAFLTLSMVFLVWNFALWFSLGLAQSVVLRFAHVPRTLRDVPLGDRLNLCLRVLKTLSRRAIRGGKTDHTIRALHQEMVIPHHDLEMTLAFLTSKGYVQASKKRMFDDDVEWQLSAPLTKLQMQDLVKDIDGSYQTQQAATTEKSGSRNSGAEALIKLESYWSRGSIADFIDWQWQQNAELKASPEKVIAKPAVQTSVSNNDHSKKLDSKGVITWFEPERYLLATKQDEGADADNLAGETTLNDVKLAIAKAEAKVAAKAEPATPPAKQASKVEEEVKQSETAGQDQPSISDIISKLSAR